MGFGDATLAHRIESILWQDWIGWFLGYRFTLRSIDSTVALMRLYCWTGAALRAVVVEVERSMQMLISVQRKWFNLCIITGQDTPSLSHAYNLLNSISRFSNH